LRFTTRGRPIEQTWSDQPGVHAKRASQYRVLTSMASWIDGTSNQAIFGEKALHPSNANMAGKGGDFTVFAWVENDADASGCSRNGAHGLTRSPQEQPDRTWSRFGSWHAGVCLFAFGDGRVDTVQNYVSTSAIYEWCHRSDGPFCCYRGD
jgi:hypothetical protein